MTSASSRPCKRYAFLSQDYVPPPLKLPCNKKKVYSDHEDEVWHCVMGPSERRLATVSANKRLVVYVFENETLSKLWAVDKIHSKDVTDVIWSYDESKVITCSKDKTIKMWSYEDGKLLNHIDDAHKDVPMALCRFEGSKDFFSAGIDGHITCWDNVGNKVMRSLTKKYTLNSLRIRYIKCSADGKFLYGVSGLKNIIVINNETNEEVSLLYESDEIVYMSSNHRGDKLLTNVSMHMPVCYRADL